MHVYTLVITPGPRRSAISRAEDLLARAVPRYFDYSGVGGWFSDRLGKVDRPELDAWYAAEAERRKRFETEHSRDPDSTEDLRELEWSLKEAPRYEELHRLRRDALIDLTRLTSELPSPLDDEMIPAAVITPQSRWRIRPAAWEQGDPRWVRWVNATIKQYRGGHCVVVADCHC